jgi:DHA1 family multidrug resistance protein-like MFS transporter
MARLYRLFLPHRDLILITTLLSVTTFTMGAMHTVLPLYAQSLGASVEQWGFIAAMWAVAMAIGEPFWGWFHDHVDRVAPFLFRVVSSSLVFLALTLPTVFWPLFLLNFWRGFGDAASWPTSRSLVSRATSPARIGLAMGVLSTGARLGGALGALVAGQIASAHGFKSTFVLSAGISLCAGLILLPRLRRPGRNRSPTPIPSPPHASVPDFPPLDEAGTTLRRYKPFLGLAGITVLSSVAWFGAMSFLPFVVTSSLGGNVATVGIVLNLASGMTALFNIPMGGLGDVVGRRRMVIGGLILSTSSLAGVAFVRSYAQIAALVSIGAIGQAAIRPSMDALVSEVAPTAARGRLMGFYGMCEDTGGILGPMLGSLTWRWGGPTAAFLTYSALAGAGSITALTLIKDHRTRPVHAVQP